MSNINLSYRGDIDGLRAVAVMSVVLYHAFPGLVPGGFIGVDIFFVISGFLISSIIISGAENGNFSFIKFYSNRIKRIFPALILIILFCIFIGWVILLPNELKQLGKHILGSTTFTSNFIYWSEVGYFDRTAETKNLLHLWSLAIEEQYYIFWPIFLTLIYKYAKKFNYILIFLAAITSYIFCVYITSRNPTFGFYSPLSRAWELMLGCLLVYHFKIYKGNKLKNNLLSITGLFLISYSLIFFNNKTIFPGWVALIPALGAYLIILAKSSAIINSKFLSNKIVIFIGLISYPLYLWHWVIFSNLRIIYGGDIGIFNTIIAIIVSVFLSYATYKYIEYPIRFIYNSKKIIIYLIVLIVMMFSFGGILNSIDLNWLRPHIVKFSLEEKKLFGRAEGYKSCSPLNSLKNSDCWTLKRNTNDVVEITLIGDSHAAHFLDGISRSKKLNQNIIVRVKYGCMPFYPLQLKNGQNYSACGDEYGMADELNDAINNKNLKKVVLSGAGFYMARQNPENFQAALYKTLDKLDGSGKKIYFLVDVPSFSFDPKECINLRPLGSYLTKKKNCTESIEAYRNAQYQYLKIVEQASLDFKKIRFIDTSQYFKDEGGNIFAMKDGVLYFNDHTHLTPAGSQYLIDKISDDIF